ncbi:MAG: CBS domain-containing protein [Acidobacteria bacterium]|nr:MAG: CBS domain-containing protein [Acidobacteriota bacterium]RPJ74951.1 MAG: CBS domain-containing protein [Acidobacteriota bacterium]
MKTVQDLLQAKGSDVYSVRPDASVYEALTLMAERNVGAVLVMDEQGRLAGILSERDYARKVVLKGQTSRDTPVRNIMTEAVLCVPAGTSIESCMAVMTERRIRHLPIIGDGRVIGVVSIGDVGKALIAEQGHVISQLEQYICGR